MFREQHQVITALAQRRYLEVQFAQPVQQVAPESALLSGALKVHVRDCDQLSVILVSIQPAQQDALSGLGQIADFVQHERAAGGRCQPKSGFSPEFEIFPTFFRQVGVAGEQASGQRHAIDHPQRFMAAP